MELKDINESIKKLQEESRQNAIELAELKIKLATRSVAWGAIGAAIPVIIMLLITFLKK